MIAAATIAVLVDSKHLCSASNRAVALFLAEAHPGMSRDAFFALPRRIGEQVASEIGRGGEVDIMGKPSLDARTQPAVRVTFTGTAEDDLIVTFDGSGRVARVATALPRYARSSSYCPAP